MADYADLQDYIQALIALRREHPALRMSDAALLREAIRFEDFGDPDNREHRIRMHIDAAAAGDSWSEVYLMANASPLRWGQALPEGSWKLIGNGRYVNPDGLMELQQRVEVAPWSVYLLVR
jgi:pullulanase